MQSDPTASANGHPSVAAPRFGSRTTLEGGLADGELVELVIALDTRAPGAARDFVVACLERWVAAPALDSAQLLVSELVTNSFRHGGAPMDEVIVSVELMPDRSVSGSRTPARMPSSPHDPRTWSPGVGSGSIWCRCSASAGASSGSPREAPKSGRSSRATGGVPAGGPNGGGSGLASRGA